MSDIGLYTTSNIISETSYEEYDPNILLHDTQQATSHFYSDDQIEHFQNQEPQQLHTVQIPQQETNTLQTIPDPSETATIQNASEISDITINNPQSLTVTNDSNIIQVPVHYITQNTHQNQNNTDINTNQDDTSTLSTSDTQITTQFQTQQPSPRNYDPPPIPPQYSTQNTPQNSP